MPRFLHLRVYTVGQVAENVQPGACSPDSIKSPKEHFSYRRHHTLFARVGGELGSSRNAADISGHEMPLFAMSNNVPQREITGLTQ